MLAKAQGTQGIKCTDNRKATDKRKIKHALRRMDGSVVSELFKAEDKGDYPRRI